MNNFGPCEKEGCIKYKENCEECVEYRKECTSIPDWRGRRSRRQCWNYCVKTKQKKCDKSDERNCIQRGCTKRKSINELNGMEIPQIHERIEKMKNIINVYEQK